MRNYYEILGIPEEASHYEIKAAFKKLAMMYHPDKHAGDPQMEERFKEINMAYQVLSDPIQKANYDYRLKYSVPTYDYVPPPPPRPGPYRRPVYKGEFTKEDLRRNTVGTLWAFGLALALATVSMAAMQGYSYYQDYKLEALLGERRIVFDQAVDEAEHGHIKEALDILSVFSTFYKEEQYIRDYKKNLIETTIRDADLLFEAGNYSKALHYYETVYPYMVYHTFDFHYRMAQCYQQTASYKKSLEMYERLLESGLRKQHIFHNMAKIYRDNLRDYEQSLHYYHKAADVAINNYIKTFGEAYIILIHAGNVPAEDLDIFLGEARGYLLVGNVEQALHETKWLANVWPKRNAIFLLRADCYRAVGNEAVACQYIDLAARVGPLPEGIQRCGVAGP